MKQRETTVLLGILTMISFCMGHTSTSVNDFWTEPIILWIAIVLPTGKNSGLSFMAHQRYHKFTLDRNIHGTTNHMLDDFTISFLHFHLRTVMFTSKA